MSKKENEEEDGRRKGEKRREKENESDMLRLVIMTLLTKGTNPIWSMPPSFLNYV